MARRAADACIQGHSAEQSGSCVQSSARDDHGMDVGTMATNKRSRIVGARSLLAVACSVASMAGPLGLIAGLAGCEEAPPPVVPTPAAMPTPTPPLTAPPPPSLPETPAPPKPVMAEAQKKFLVELEAALTARDVKKLGTLYSTGAVLRSSGRNGVHDAAGREEIEKARGRGLGVVGKAFPDIKWSHTRALQKDEVMVVEWIVTATDTGGFLEDKPTNKKVGWRGVSVITFDDDGLVKQEIDMVDPMTLQGQLGKGDPKVKVRPPPAAPSSGTQFVTAKNSPEEQKNLDTVKALYASFEKKDEKASLALMTDDVVHADLTAPDDVKGKDAAKKELGAWFKAFPDAKVNATNVWAFGDTVVAELETTGTFKGPLGSLKPNGKAGTTHAVDIVEMKDGKIARVTSYASTREFLTQYDLMPKPATPPAPPATTAAPKP